MSTAGMTNEQFNERLELLAKSIERSANNVEEAAQIVREAKISNEVDTENDNSSYFDFDSDDLAMPEVRVERKRRRS